MRILDRSQYTKKTLDTFEIISSYFVDIYINHLYLEAKKFKTDKRVKSITEGYKHTLNAFIQGIDNPKLYKKTLLGIHNLFVASGFNITFSECIQRINQEFIPVDYYESISKTQQVAILKLVINQSNKEFIEKIVRKFLVMIIDNHDDVDNIRILQDEFIDILMLERENLYNKFIITKTKSKSGGEGVSPVLVEKMKNEIKSLCKEKYDLKKSNLEMKKSILRKDAELNIGKKTIESLTLELEKLRSSVNEKQFEIQMEPVFNDQQNTSEPSKVENDNDIMNGMMNDTKKPDEPGFTENDINLMPGTIDLDGWGFD
jgi:hypothetical protein